MKAFLNVLFILAMLCASVVDAKVLSVHGPDDAEILLRTASRHATLCFIYDSLHVPSVRYYNTLLEAANISTVRERDAFTVDIREDDNQVMPLLLNVAAVPSLRLLLPSTNGLISSRSLDDIPFTPDTLAKYLVLMVFTDKLKTFVGRALADKTSNALSAVGSQKAPASLAQVLSQAASMTSKLFEEREWQCPCGHRFRAAGEWVACAPIYCEVPSCPNPKYYIDGPGRALLEANPSGVKLQATSDSNSNALPKAAGGSQSTTNTSHGVGSRFR